MAKSSVLDLCLGVVHSGGSANPAVLTWPKTDLALRGLVFSKQAEDSVHPGNFPRFSPEREQRYLNVVFTFIEDFSVPSIARMLVTDLLRQSTLAPLFPHRSMARTSAIQFVDAFRSYRFATDEERCAVVVAAIKGEKI